MDWDNFFNKAADFLKGVGAVAGAVLDEIGREVYRNYILLLMNATNSQEDKWTFLAYQIANGNFLSELQFSDRTQLFDDCYAAVQQGRIPSVQDCCTIVASSLPNLPIQCWNDTVVILCYDGNMSNDRIAYLQQLAYMFGINADPNYIMQYVSTVMQNFNAVRSYYEWYWNQNENKLPKNQIVKANFIAQMVTILGLRVPSQEQMLSVELISPGGMGFVSFLFGAIGLDWFTLGHKGRAFFKLLFSVLLFLVFIGIISLSPTISKWVMRIGIPVWFIIWIKDFASSIPNETREHNLKKACEELPKVILQ